MGFTKEFAPDKTNVAFPYKREGYKPDLYALLTYGNMPVQPRFRVKFLLKFKYENVVRLAFQKKFYSKTRMDGHITIREKSVLPVKKEKRQRTNGSNINKDTIAIMRNVTVSFLCLLAPPWR